MASAGEDARDVAAILGTNERLVSKLHPHAFSFFRYYGIGILLLIWTIVMTWLFYWGYLKDFESIDWFGEGLNPMLPALLWFLVAVILGLTVVRRFNVALQALYWVAAVLMLVLVGLFVWLWDRGDIALEIAIGYAYLDAILTILVAELYRRSFSYYITDMRIVIRHKLFSSHEVNLRFEKIEDWKIARSFIWRLLGVGTIRPYTGTEDGKADADRGFDAPDECMYGIKNPEGVKRLLVDLVLERDRIGPTGYEAPVPQEAEAPAQEPTVEEEELVPVEPAAMEAPAPAAYPEPATSQVAYYQPAAPSAPPPTRNYERIDPAAHAAEERIPPPEPDEEEDEEEGAPPVRMMYPQAQEPGTETRLEDDRSMAFEPSRPGRPSRKPKKEEDWEEDPDTEVYDEGRPRAL